VNCRLLLDIYIENHRAALCREDVKIIVANPRTAGVARWIFLALWGHKLRHGEVAARRYVTKVFDNVEIMPRDAREASDVFYTQKFGDVLLTYENEAVFTNLVVSPKSPLPFISPNNNVRIVCPGSLIDRNLEGKPPEVIEAAKSFMNYLFTPDAQKEFLECGFRSAIATLENIEGIDNLPAVKKVWDVEKRLGSWSTVQKKFFDEEVRRIVLSLLSIFIALMFLNCCAGHFERNPQRRVSSETEFSTGSVEEGMMRKNILLPQNIYSNAAIYTFFRYLFDPYAFVSFRRYLVLRA